MAVPTLSTGHSRRAILAGSVAVPALALSTLSPCAAPVMAGRPDPDLLADAELFRRIAVAERLRNRHARARRRRDRLRDAKAARGGLASLPTRGPYRHCHAPAFRRCAETYRRYAEAVRDAVAMPAHTPAGIHAKLALSLIAARRGGARVYMYEDHDWSEAVLTDLERLIANRYR